MLESAYPPHGKCEYLVVVPSSVVVHVKQLSYLQGSFPLSYPPVLNGLLLTHDLHASG